MIPLILFIILAVIVLVLTELRERKRKRSQISNQTVSNHTPITNPDNSRPEGCCGEHLVCERETLLQTNAEIVYYDDEELDILAGIDPADYTPEQHQAIREIFSTLQESDVPGWCRSLQLRNITLPPDIREEALLIVRERRSSAAV